MAGTDREKVLQTLPRALELGGDGLALGLERFEVLDPLAQGGELVDELLLGLLVVVAAAEGREASGMPPDVLLECLATLSFVHHSSLRWGGLRPSLIAWLHLLQLQQLCAYLALSLACIPKLRE